MDMWNLEGHKIEGKYHGVPFRGTVISSRSAYGRYPAIIHFIELEKSITVYGEPRQSLVVKTDDEPDISEFVVVE
jgi:hypothetical protein